MVAPVDDRLKEAMKAALVELLEERSDLVRDIVAEALEEVALVRAIQEGEDSDTVSREAVFRALSTSE
jgi:DNA-binding phage protein